MTTLPKSKNITGATSEFLGLSKEKQLAQTERGVKELQKNLNEFALDPKRTPVTTISNQSGKKIVDQYSVDQSGDEEKIRIANEKANTDTLALKSLGKNKNPQGFSFDEAKELGLDLNNAKYDPLSNTYSPLDGDTSISDKNKQSKRDLEEIDRVFSSQEKMLDSATNAVINSIKGTYKALAAETAEANNRAMKSYEMFGVREGGQRYAGEVQQGILNAETRAGLRRLEEIAAKEASEIAGAKTALASQKYSLFVKKREEIKTLREKRQEEIDKLQEEAKKKREEFEQTKAQASRDSAVADLLTQGITDPKQMLEFLNFTEDGEQVGDFTAEEVAKSMKALSPDGNIEKLSGNIRDYFILKENGSLPSNISTLPPDQQLNAWMSFVKPVKATGTGGAKNKITVAEAKSNNLPLSVVGMSEDDILGSMYESVPPNWFVEKLSRELRMSVGPEKAQTTWDEYRESFIEDFETDTKVSEATDYTERAKGYFQSAYGDALDDESLQTLADYVQSYVEGGMTYAKAVEKVIEDAQ